VKLEFPYQFDSHYRRHYPIISLRIFGQVGGVTEVTAYLDSGAAFNVFKEEEALALGLNLRRAPKREIVAGDGRRMHCAMADLKIEVGGYRFTTPVGFSRDLKVGVNILGLEGFFDRFHEIAFQHRERQVILRV
jgi:hypothetical protein